MNKTTKVDTYTIDLTRSKDKEQSHEDLFSAIEQIKNGYVIDTRFGKHNRSIFELPMVLIFTNINFDLIKEENYLSWDR